MATKISYELGQTVWVCLTYHREDDALRPCTITKIGRKWISLSWPGQIQEVYRFDVANLLLDGGTHSSPGRVYLSVEDRETEVALDKAWDNLQAIARQRCPSNLTLDDIQTALKALKIETK